MDRISKLPSGIIENILCLLPIQEAARTSILSKDWRYHWIKIPKLAFIEDTFEVSTEPSVLERMRNRPSERRHMTRRCKLFYAIYQVLLMHEGPIHEFTLSMIVDWSCVEIDHIILHLAKKNTVKILELEVYGEYTLPLSFFSLNQLTDLYLAVCTLCLPQSFSGFGSLTTLCLEMIATCEKTLLRLLSGSPLLKRLALNSDCGSIKGRGHYTTADLFGCLPVIEHLSVWFYIVMNFISERLPKDLPTSLVHLKYLFVQDVSLTHRYGLPFLFLLIRSSPNLEKLKLEIVDENWFEEHEICSFTLDGYSNISLEHLNELEIIYFIDWENENDMDFVKLIVAKSPVLKKVKIFLQDEDQFDVDKESRILNVLLRSPSASPEVRFVVRQLKTNTQGRRTLRF